MPAAAFPCAGTDLDLTHPGYTILECEGCGLVFKSHTLSAKALDRFYDSLDYAPFDTDYGFPTDKCLLSILRKLPVGSRVLDFGCSTGRILNELGSRYQRFGIEVNEAAAERARQRGITVIPEAALETSLAGKFDAIILSDVFEHLVEPTITLRRLAARLGPGGRLILVTGLADAVNPRALIGEHWYFRIGGHLHMLNRRHLDWLGRTLGLDVASVEVMSHYKRVPVRFAKQWMQRALYRVVQLERASTMAAVVRGFPGLKRAHQWINLPATDQMQDHVVAVFIKPTCD